MAKINAVKMVRSIRDKHYRLTKRKSPAATIGFYRAKANAFQSELKCTESSSSREK